MAKKASTPKTKSGKAAAREAAIAEQGAQLAETERRFTDSELAQLRLMYDATLGSLRRMMDFINATAVKKKDGSVKLIVQEPQDSFWYAHRMFKTWRPAEHIDMDEYAERTGYVPPEKRIGERHATPPPSLAPPPAPEPVKTPEENRVPQRLAFDL